MTTSWGKKSASLHTIGRKLEDGAMYIIDLEDMCPAGVLVQAYRQETSDRYTLSVSESEVRGMEHDTPGGMHLLSQRVRSLCIAPRVLAIC